MLTFNRRQLLRGFGAAGIVSALAPQLLAKADTEDAFQFLFITDCHIQPELDAASGTDSAFKKARAMQADFTIQGGDHVFDACAVSKQRALSLFDLYAKTEQDLGMKVYHTLGNHDCLSMEGLLFRRRIPNTASGCTKSALARPTTRSTAGIVTSWCWTPSIRCLGHTFEARVDNEPQLAELGTDLAVLAPGTPVIIVTHIPLVAAVAAYIPAESPMREYIPLLSVSNSAQVLEETLAGHNVIAVLQGHTHINETVIWKRSIITGGAVCGNWWHGSHLGNPEGFTVVKVVGAKVTTHYETYGFKSVDPQKDFG